MYITRLVKTFHLMCVCERDDNVEENVHVVTVVTFFSVNEVKTRAASLRTQYGKLIRAKPSGSGQKPLASKQNWILQHLDFLKAHVTHRPTESTLTVSDMKCLQV